MCELGDRCDSPEYDHAIRPQIPLRLVGEFTGSHSAPPVGCGYFSGIAIKKLHQHGFRNLAEVRSSRLEVYQARENYLIQRRVITRNSQILTHRHEHPLLVPEAVGFLSSLGLPEYVIHPVIGRINPSNVCEQIDRYMGGRPGYGLMVAHLLSESNAHWMSILSAAAGNRFLVYDPCGAGGFADHVRVITPERMSSFYGSFPWSHIIGAPVGFGVGVGGSFNIGAGVLGVRDDAGFIY